MSSGLETAIDTWRLIDLTALQRSLDEEVSRLPNPPCAVTLDKQTAGSTPHNLDGGKGRPQPSACAHCPTTLTCSCRPPRERGAANAAATPPSRCSAASQMPAHPYFNVEEDKQQ